MWIYLVHHYFFKYLEKEAKIGHWPVIVYAIRIEGRFLQQEGDVGRVKV